MGILDTLRRAVIWWDGSTLGTQIFTRRHGEKVGEDEQGNTFYQSKDGARRWVMYNGEAEASRIGAAWHGWLHHTYQDPPTSDPLPRKDWEKPHLENVTGTAMAYVPPGSLRRSEPVQRADYEAWTPE